MTNAARREQQTFKLSSLTLSVYLPTLLFSIGEGAVLPIIPLFARGRGASVAAAALVVAMRGLGNMDDAKGTLHYRYYFLFLPRSRKASPGPRPESIQP